MGCAGCRGDNACCQENDTSWFCATLPAVTIERGRLCLDDVKGD